VAYIRRRETSPAALPETPYVAEKETPPEANIHLSNTPSVLHLQKKQSIQ
jgi:hypothetical protein